MLLSVVTDAELGEQTMFSWKSLIHVSLMIGLTITTTSLASAQLSGLGQVMERANEAAAGASGTRSVEDFRLWVNKLIANPQTDVKLPKDWFAKHFDANTARALQADYQESLRTYGSLAAVITDQKAKGHSKVVVAMHSKAIDPTATGWQNAALQRMTTKVPLYSLRMMRPEAESGLSLVSFVAVDGRFAFAGKLGALHDPKGDLATKVLCTTPLGKFDAMLREKGLIETTGVEHLKKAGVLK